jgi:hypothetical protein
MLKKNNETKLASVSSPNCILEQATNLSFDLGEEGKQGPKDHEDPTLQEIKEARVIRKKKQRLVPSVVRRSLRINKKGVYFFIMHAIFWNSDGFGDLAKHFFVRETIREHKLDFFAILETRRSNFSSPFLEHLAAGLHYQWYCLPPLGRSGSMLVGFNAASLQIQNVITSDRCVKFYVFSKIDNFKWVMVVVYGAAQEEYKPEFLAELVRICEDEPLPMLVGGDFNIIRRQDEKNNESLMLDGLLFLLPLSRVLTREN